MKYPILLYLIALALVLSVTLADLHYFVGVVREAGIKRTINRVMRLAR